mmetsp:Transcript_76784/g.173665  ORF Transcript_76784/g.173665 Transcript_76784/m.173665 type:complete len:209 (-) Transcript_76784:87-713(-)
MLGAGPDRRRWSQEQGPRRIGPVGLIPFFQGVGTDDKGRTLEQILRWDNDTMEMVHDYIQWLFPTNEASQFNPHAPLLTRDVVHAFHQDETMQRNFRRCLDRFFAFLGLEFRGGGDQPLKVAKAANFESRTRTCWRGMMGMGNHNWLRITRVLHCLGMLGMKKEQQALYQCLERLYQDGLPVESAIGHWRERAGVRGSAGISSMCLVS